MIDGTYLYDKHLRIAYAVRSVLDVKYFRSIFPKCIDAQEI